MKRVGDTAGRLTIVTILPNARLVCRCECGAMTEIGPTNWRKTQSCGCLLSQMLQLRNSTHGLSHRAEYRIWKDMKRRCYSPKRLKWYGERGITVCERWRTSFEAFLQDVGPRLSPDHSIDRIDNDKPYEPGNVKWSTRSEQAVNKRDTAMVFYRGMMRSVVVLSREHGLRPKTVKARLRYGWTIEKALTTPLLR